jgi:hypothetical protein
MSSVRAAATRPAVATPAFEPLTFDRSDPRFSIRYRTSRVVIHADGGPLAPRIAKAIANEVQASMDFHLETLGWQTQPGVTRPLHVYVCTADLLKRYGMSVGGGVAWDRDTYVMSRREARGEGDDPNYRLNTEAHEDLHNLQMRVDSSDWNPSYFYEGLACVMSNRWAVTRLGKVDWLREEAKAMVEWTPAQARRVITQMRGNWEANFPDGAPFSGWDAELMGALMVEFFRQKYGAPGEAGFHQLGGVSLDIAKGMTFEQAFMHQFNVPLTTAEAAFVAFMRDTTADPAARLKGTVWQGYA